MPGASVVMMVDMRCGGIRPGRVTNERQKAIAELLQFIQGMDLSCRRIDSPREQG